MTIWVRKNIVVSRVSKAFWCGCFFHMGLVGFIQDWMGKQEVLRSIDENWLNTHWLMWGGVVVIAFFIYGRCKIFSGRARNITIHKDDEQ